MSQNQQDPRNPILSWLIIGIVAYLAWQHFKVEEDGKIDPDKPDVIEADDVWESVAVLVKEGDPEDTQELCALVIQLKEVNLLTQAQVDDFNDAFPGICETDRDLTDADAEKLRGLE